MSRLTREVAEMMSREIKEAEEIIEEQAVVIAILQEENAELREENKALRGQLKMIRQDRRVELA